jgi:probable phosphoglycerate mutase
MRLLLIRHAEPEAAMTGVVAGSLGCTGLTEQGRAQAGALARRLQAEGQTCDVLYSSVLARSVETAEIIAASLGVHDVVQDCDLCELHPGACDGADWDDQVRVRGTGGEWDPDEPMSPGGESLRAFDLRVRAALQRLMDFHAGESVAIVTHGGLITAAMLFFLGLPGVADKRSFALTPNYTSLTEWSQPPGSGDWVLDRYNDAAHLPALA